MSLFDETTIEETSPEGQEATETVETEEQPEESQEELDDSGEETTEEDTPSAEAEQGEELLAGKFKSVEDLTKSYRNLERAFHESRQPKQPAPQTTAHDEEDPNYVVQSAFERDPIGTLQYFAKQAIAPLVEQRETENLTRNMEIVSKPYAKQLSTDEGVKAFFEKIGEIANELGNEGLVRNPSPRVLKMAAEELWGTETRQQTYDKAKAAGRQEAEATRQAKQGLHAPKGAKPKEQPKTEADRIREGILNASRSGGMLG